MLGPELDKLLTEFNAQPNQNDFDALFDRYYGTHAAELKDNYEKGLVELNAAKKLPPFEDLPVLIFRVAPDFSVVFDKERQLFLLKGSIPLIYELIQAMETRDDSASAIWDFYCRYNEFNELRSLLQELSVHGDYSRVFFQGVEALKSLAIEESIAYYWEAKFYFHHGDYQAAEKAIIKALNIRKIDENYWRLMSAVQERLGNAAESYFYKALLSGHFDKSIPLDPPMEDADVVKAVSLAGIGCNLSPFMYRLFVNEQGELDRKISSLAGEYLSYNPAHDYREYCGIYNSYTWKNYRSDLCDKFREWGYTIPAYLSMAFDIMKSIRQSSLTVDCPQGMECIVPLTGEKTAQRLVFASGEEVKTIAAAKREFAFYRFGEGKTKVVSDSSFQVGKPVWLGHSSKRKKLVLQLFADGLPWQVIKEQGYRNVPHIMKFFSAGVIFENHFSFSEYTFPSVPTLETGYYAYHTQVFNEKVMMRIDESKLTTSEQMSDLGYYCAYLMGDGAGVYNGALRGFDRKIIQQANVRCYEGVERLISHLDAFDETDNYAYIHFMDAHPYFSDIPESVYTQTKLPLYDRLQEDYKNSVFMENSKKIQADNQYRIRRMDTELQLLFDYIQEHYAEDEYIVALYSDHGTSIYDDKNYLLSERQTGASMMFRGGGVSKLGKVEELTSTADLYPIMGRLCGFPVSDDIDGNLPAAFGGRERAYVVSMSIFPGQTFKLCLRDKEYEFRMETTAYTSVEGLVDMSDYTTHIYQRCDRQEILSDKLYHYFMGIAWSHIKSFAVNACGFRT